MLNLKCNDEQGRLVGLKENVICGHLIPAGTGQRDFDIIVVYSRIDYDKKWKHERMYWIWKTVRQKNN